MSRTITLFKLGGVATAVAAVTLAAAGSVYVNAQNNSGRGPAVQQGGPAGRGPGGPGDRFGGPGRRGGPLGPRGILGPLPLDRLGLTETQREQIRTVMQSHDAELKTLNDRAITARQALQTTVLAEAFDEGAIRARSADVAAVEADLAVSRARIRTEVLQMLTPEQRARAKELPPPGGGRPGRGGRGGRPSPPVQ